MKDMHRGRLKQAEMIFHMVVDLPPAEREALLAQSCANDPELRAFVDRLLHHDETGGGGVLDHPPSGDESDTIDATATVGLTLGPYVLRQHIGSGGMGEVWRAEQTSPVRRTVALKLIKAGMDTGQVMARFEAERQALALMDHPAIAKVFDAGATPQGRPYFAMEYVQGLPITEFCDAHRLGARERLELFQRVCEGVQHAHQKAILHRDLKPSNILVSYMDGKPQPRIIDFGVAKATKQKLTEKTMYTALGHLIGTPEYMSPEQADLAVEDVDTRTDVYSLGVVLYELLAGALPFDTMELRQAGFEGILRLLREKDPPRPSTKVSSLGVRTAEVAQNRGTEPRRLVGQLRGDLDWIVMRSLEKDRNRRYGSPRELAQDIARHLNDEAVLAGPPDPVYRTRKFVRRHRVALGFLVLVLLGIGTGLVESNRQRMKVEAALTVAQEERARAVREAEKANEVSQFVQEMLGANSPDNAGYTAATDSEREFARGILDRAADNLETRLADQPEILAAVRDVLGTTYAGLGFRDAARPHLEASLAIRREIFGDRHPDVATSLQHLGELALTADYDHARSLLEQALEIRREALGERHPEVAGTLLTMGNLEWYWSPDVQVWSLQERSLDRAERLVRESLEIRKETGDVPVNGIADCMKLLAQIQLFRGEFQTAVSLSREGLAARRALLGPDHYLVSLDLTGLAVSLRAAGDPARAEPLLREAHAICVKRLSERHFGYMQSKGQLGLCLWDQGKFLAADSLYLEALAVARTHRPMSEFALLSIPDRLAMSRLSQGDYTGADSIARDLVARTRAAHGSQSLVMTRVLDQVAMIYLAMDRNDEAVAAQHEALAVHRYLYGDEHREVAMGLIKLAQALYIRGDRGLGDYEEAETYLRGARDMLRQLYGDEIPWYFQTRLWITWGLMLVEQGRSKEAEPILRQALDISHGHSRRNAWAKAAYGSCLTSLGRYEEAEDFLLSSHDALRGLYRDRVSFHFILRWLIDLYQRLGDAERARSFEAELRGIIAPPTRQDS